MSYPGKARGIQKEEQRHQTLSKLVLKRKLHESVRFVYDMEKGGVLQPDELAEYSTVTINETVTLVLEGKHPREKFPHVPG